MQHTGVLVQILKYRGFCSKLKYENSRVILLSHKVTIRIKIFQFQDDIFYVNFISTATLLKNHTPKKFVKSSALYLALVLLCNSKDIETNPGPVKYPCQICNKAVKWTPPGVCCDSCDLWYHKDCMGMSLEIYASLQNILCYCVQCGLPNFSTSLFETTHVEDANSFTPLSLGPGSPGSPNTPDINFDPTITSSPNPTDKVKKRKHRRKDIPLKVAVVNFRSVVNRKPELLNLIDASQPDIIIGTETWPDNTITDAEICPPGYNMIRRDRTTSKGGGVLILTSDKYISSEPSERAFTAYDGTKNNHPSH